MKKTLLAIFAALAMSSSMAYATNNQNNSNNTTNYNTTTNQGGDALAMQDVDVKVGVNTNITNDVRTNASAFAGANSDSKSNATATGGNATGGTAVSGGNTQNTTITDSGKLEYSGNYTVDNVPNVVASDIHPTSPCMGSSSGGFAVAGFGASMGTSWTDDECGIRETARSFAGVGLQQDALAILCTSKYAAAAPSCKKD